MGGIEPHMFLLQLVLLGNLPVEFPTRAVLENEEELLSILKSIEHSDDKGVVDLHQHIPLNGDEGFLLLCGNVLFGDDLHGEHFLGGVVPH